jgi:hypothetical protein
MAIVHLDQGPGELKKENGNAIDTSIVFPVRSMA